MSRSLDWKPVARRDLQKLSPLQRERVIAAMERYAATDQGDVRKLTDVSPPEYRLRVGDWRVLFAPDPENARRLVVLHVRHRSDAYR